MGAATNTQSGEREKLRLEAVTPELLAEVTRRIVDAVEPDRILLFGSYAGGTPREYSDLDLLVVKPGAYNRLDVAAHIDGLFWDMSLPLDVIVLTPGQVAREVDVGNTFVRDRIFAQGRVLYERAA